MNEVSVADRLNLAWNALREALKRNFTFSDIKSIVGLSGFDLTSIANLDQRKGIDSTKGQLMTGIDNGLNGFDFNYKNRFLSILAEEILQRRPDLLVSVTRDLSRLGFYLFDNVIIPSYIYDVQTIDGIPEVARIDFGKALQRLRDNDLSGAITSACSALDSAMSEALKKSNVNDYNKKTFQEKLTLSLKEVGFYTKLKDQLQELEWDNGRIDEFVKNYSGAMNQFGYVMRKLRSDMGDVHGTKPVLCLLVHQCIRLSEVLLMSLA